MSHPTQSEVLRDIRNGTACKHGFYAKHFVDNPVLTISCDGPATDPKPTTGTDEVEAVAQAILRALGHTVVALPQYEPEIQGWGKEAARAAIAALGARSQVAVSCEDCPERCNNPLRSEITCADLVRENDNLRSQVAVSGAEPTRELSHEHVEALHRALLARDVEEPPNGPGRRVRCISDEGWEWAKIRLREILALFHRPAPLEPKALDR